MRGIWRQIWFCPSLIFALTLVTRLRPGNLMIPGWDEWILATISSRVGLLWLPSGELYDLLVPTGYSYPPFYFWISGALVYVYGGEPWVWRLPATLSDAGAAAMVAVLARYIAGPAAGWTAGLLACASLFLAFHQTVTLDYLLAFWILLSIWLYLKALDTHSFKLLLAAVFAGSLAPFTKYHGIVYFAPLCFAVVCVKDSRALITPRRLPALVCAALTLPVLLLCFEGLTWRFYGYEKTHIAEVFRVMTWTSYVPDPLTGEIVKPTWFYYFQCMWAQLGTMALLMAFLGILRWGKPRPRNEWLLLIFLALWLTWASTASLKNARYVLPAVYIIFVFAGRFVGESVKQDKFLQYTAYAFLTLALLSGLGLTEIRWIDYRNAARTQAEVCAMINEQTPEDAVLLAEGRPFQTDDGVGIHPIKRRVISPESPKWETQADYIIADDRSGEMLAARMIPVDESYLRARDSILREWELELMAYNGQYEIYVLKRPENWRFPSQDAP
ncbi:MAG: glycosyltransferase family 39 protein [Candidatus Hydrogenedentes bacterium]|nr:glycosyltransferase family 39 protein [Candidatus Hydrogenedentota bacterium]